MLFLYIICYRPTYWNWLAPNHVIAPTSRHVVALTSRHVVALTSRDVVAPTSRHVVVLTSRDVVTLTSSNVVALTSRDVAALTSRDVVAPTSYCHLDRQGGAVYRSTFRTSTSPSSHFCHTWHILNKNRRIRKCVILYNEDLLGPVAGNLRPRSLLSWN